MQPEKMIFLNIGWMGNYEGYKHQTDKIVGGGDYVRTHGTGHEVCNFLNVSGKVFGHVETIRGEVDRKIQLIDKLGGKNQDSIEDITVIWTATHPINGRGYVVGWYKHARVYRQRQHSDKYISKQHKLDGVKTYMVEADARHSVCIPVKHRALRLPKTIYPGQTPWRIFQNPLSTEDTQTFNEIIEFMNSVSHVPQKDVITNLSSSGSGATASSSYVRYISANEIHIAPSHHKLQSKFCSYLKLKEYLNVQEDVDFVDVRYLDKKGCSVLAEIKPCNFKDARYAIRTAIGQLLDYQQKSKNDNKLLIVVEVEPNIQDQNLALNNGFGVGFPKGNGFNIIWP